MSIASEEDSISSVDFDLHRSTKPEEYATNTITRQPGRLPFRDWRDGLCDCTNDCHGCWCVTFCPPCYLCYLYYRYGEHPCVACLNPCAVAALRTFHRGRERIRGTLFEDCLFGTVCLPCTICQVDRDMKYCELVRGYLDV
ncbi:unnamed protein product [Dicrocoelium dendriticum]|nr:unnamed protein product [Dicrocoelium dendriticum]CAH8467210.1 unnamed protein product [Dicrocoelium dendriticum]